MKRKEFIKTSIGLGTGAMISSLPFKNKSSAWNKGIVSHMIPQVNHNRILLSISTNRPLEKAPSIKVGKKKIIGSKRDGLGQHWFFDIQDLESKKTYELKLLGNSGRLCDDWTIKTFPSPSAETEKMRLLVYTCAGGHPLSRELHPRLNESRQQFISRRSALLKKGLSFNPDAIIAIGDQIYWDLEEVLPGIAGDGANELAFSEAGQFDKSIPILGTSNEEVLKKAVGPQVADLYGTHCRSTPVFMFNDDHDYFENDKATPSSITFPPRHFNLKLARTAQGMYWPEFLPDLNRPIGLSGSNASDKALHSSECFGTLRFGRLAEILMYDCRRFTTLKGPSAGFIPRDTEQWLMNRVSSDDTLYTINVPSLPVGWSAGKWMEWYPDKLNSEGKLTTEIEKYFWQQGWQNQHDRLLQHFSNQRHKKPIFFQGDLHTFAGGQIYKSGEIDLGKNPAYAYIMGTMGSTAWPSGIRQVKASNPSGIGMEEYFDNVEESGFSIVDITTDEIEINMYKYLSGRDELSIIDQLTPFQTLKIKR
tara:strand:- start:668 stop:2269 length:1602 start_codon:yes stop_codon:yes gene_type:complete